MGAQISSPYYLTDGQFFMNGSNIVTSNWTNVSNAFLSPVATKSMSIAGYDWTKTFPGSALSGHSINLAISQEMHVSENIVENATTVLSSLNFGTPTSLMVNQTQPKAMDPSWFVCRHVFVSTKSQVKSAVDGGAACSFLPSACQNDLKTSLTQDWGQLDAKYMCGALIFDPIPSSCSDSFGFARQDVMAFDSTFLANSTVAPSQVSSLQQPYTWRMGTQYHDPGSAHAFAIAANRTYLIATVWGYSSSASSGIRKTPDVSFGCLSSGPAHVPPPPPPPPVSSSSSTAKSTSSSTTRASTTSSISSSKGTTTTTPAMPTSTDGRCGANVNGATCQGTKNGNCCSVKGNCGTTDAFCSLKNLCQPNYGTCTT